jgi:hypothetical protein
MTSRAGGDAALGVTGEYEACTSISFPQPAAALRNALARVGPQSTGAACKIGRNIGRVLDRQRFGDGIDNAPGTLSRAVIGKLLENHRRIHSIEHRDA